MFVCSMRLISVLHSQSKFQIAILTLFSGRHIGVPQRNTNMAAPYKTLQFTRNISTDISTLEQRKDLKLGELSSLLIFYNITIS